MISLMLLGEIESIKNYRKYLENYHFISVEGAFTDPIDLIRNINTSEPLAIMIDLDYFNLYDLINMYHENQFNLRVDIIFISSTRYYAAEAYDLNAIDYMVKPVTNLRLEKAVMKLKERYKKCSVVTFSENEFQISCFGSFQLTKTENAENKFNWRTKKVKELLAYLICRFDRPVSKEELTYHLFDKSNKDKEAQNNLYVTMSYLRKALGEFGLHRNLLLINKDYSLELKEDICDYITFEKFTKNHVNIDDSNIFLAERIIESYKGTLLEEEDYNWSIELREYCDNKYEELLFMIAEYYKENSNYKKYESFLLKVLTNNPISIEANQNLLNLYMEHNKRDYYIRQYQKYRKMMLEDYDDKPERKYTEIYNKIESGIIEKFLN